MSWLQKLLPPRIKSTPGVKKTAVPEGLWIKCPSCETVLYRTDLEKNLYVCPKCSFHVRVHARDRIEQLLDPEGRFEIGSEVVPVDSLKFKDQKKYPERLAAAHRVGHPIDSLNDAGGRKKIGPEIIDFEQRRARSRSRLAAPSFADDPAHNVTPSKTACSLRAHAGERRRHRRRA